MKYLLAALLLPFIFGIVAWSSPTATSRSAANTARHIDVSIPTDVLRETVLLVSLEDGSVIKQTIYSHADLCFKMNSDSATTCLTQGEPIYDPTTNTVIGFEMIEERIELVAKSY